MKNTVEKLTEDFLPVGEFRQCAAEVIHMGVMVCAACFVLNGL